MFFFYILSPYIAEEAFHGLENRDNGVFGLLVMDSFNEG